jgi:hypothetical protein
MANDILCRVINVGLLWVFRFFTHHTAPHSTLKRSTYRLRATRKYVGVLGRNLDECCGLEATGCERVLAALAGAHGLEAGASAGAHGLEAGASAPCP